MSTPNATDARSKLYAVIGEAARNHNPLLLLARGVRQCRSLNNADKSALNQSRGRLRSVSPWLPFIF